MVVLDVGAGLGGTAAETLKYLGPAGRIICIEPAAAMRRAGRGQQLDSRVQWRTKLPRSTRVDRVLCGASLWQLLPLGEMLARLRGLLKNEGALCFNIPALYLGQADEPGGGRDPHLFELTRAVKSSRPESTETTRSKDTVAPLSDAADLEKMLSRAGFRSERWSFSIRLTQRAWCDWLKVPVVSEGLLGGVAPRERARCLDAAFARCDPASWRHERWLGWTAWAV